MNPTLRFGSDDITPWTLAQIYADIVGRVDLPDILKVSKASVRHYIDDRDKVASPLPIKRVGHVDLYSMQEWRDWLQRYRDRPTQGSWRDRLPTAPADSFWSYFRDSHSKNFY